MATQAKSTIDHDIIREWVEERGGRPSVVRSTKSGESGLLRIDFGIEDQNLEEISWADFFRIFEDNDLAFLYQEVSDDGGESYFCKFVSRSEEDGGAAPAERGEADEESY